MSIRRERQQQVDAIKARLLELGDDEATLEGRAVRADFVTDETRDLF